MCWSKCRQIERTILELLYLIINIILTLFNALCVVVQNSKCKILNSVGTKQYLVDL